eukprot:PhM_4_TR754/c0_g1_i1/m.95641
MKLSPPPPPPLLSQQVNTNNNNISVVAPSSRSVWLPPLKCDVRSHYSAKDLIRETQHRTSVVDYSFLDISSLYEIKTRKIEPRQHGRTITYPAHSEEEEKEKKAEGGQSSSQDNNNQSSYVCTILKLNNNNLSCLSSGGTDGGNGNAARVDVLLFAASLSLHDPTHFLSVLDLSYNKLQTCPAGLEGLTLLRKLCLHYNDITDLDQVLAAVSNVKYLISLTLYGNKRLDCASSVATYRAHVVQALPQLKNFDEAVITPKDRTEAKMFREFYIASKYRNRKQPVPEAPEVPKKGFVAPLPPILSPHGSAINNNAEKHLNNRKTRNANAAFDDTLMVFGPGPTCRRNSVFEIILRGSDDSSHHYNHNHKKKKKKKMFSN